MLKNFFVTALRNFKKNVSHTVLNIIGLAVGLSCCLVVYTIIEFEYSFDHWHSKKDRIYRVTNIYHGDNGTVFDGISPYPTGEALMNDLPELEKIVEFQGPYSGEFSFTDSKGDFQIFGEDRLLMTNENFFEVMDFQLLSGDPSQMGQPNKIYLSEELAKKYFKDEDPVGKVVRLDGEVNLDVAGVIENSPSNTNLPYDCIVSIKTLRGTQKRIWDNWGMTWAYSIYALIPSDSDIEALNIKIDQVIDGYANPDDEEEQAKTEIALQPLSEIHNDEKYGDGYNYVTPSLLIWAFIFLGALILGTACLNFINLSTAQAIQRSKEVGIRKTLGSNKKQLVTQFLTETFTIVAISMLLALSFGQFLLERFNQMLSAIEYNLEYNNTIMVFAVVLTFGVTILAGFYPSIILSGYRPVEALKNKININKGSGNFNIRRSLVIVQFAFTTIMLIGTLIISAQVSYMKNKDLGFDSNFVVSIDTPSKSDVDPSGLLDAYKSKNFVQEATLAFSTPMAQSNWNNSYRIPNEDPIDGNDANMKFIDEDFIDFYKIPLLAGENITEQFINDSTYNVLVTKQLLVSLGWTDPFEVIGKQLTTGSGNQNFNIVGVLEDFNVSTAHSQVRPAMMMFRPKMMKKISLRLPNDNINSYVGELEDTFREFYPNGLFEFEILKNEIDSQYLTEDILHKVIQFVSILAILLSIMGLFGLISFIANRNAKAIGIRKVFGATTFNILSIFSKEYFKLMVISFLFAAPAAYYLMDIWIQEFAFRIDLSIYYFLGGFVITLAIALITVGYRSLIAARANPIQSLRYE